MFKGHIAEGMVIATGAAITIQTGWIPSRVELLNEDGLAVLVWHSNMAAGHGVKTVAAGTMTKITAGGISPYAGERGLNGPGFTIGVDAQINVAGQRLHYHAVSTDA